MDYVFEVVDKSGRKIRLTKKQWKHILKKHSDMANYEEEIKQALKNPDKITEHPFDENGRYYYKYLKNKPDPNKYLLTIVKYLNGEGFIITIYFIKDIRWK